MASEGRFHVRMWPRSIVAVSTHHRAIRVAVVIMLRTLLAARHDRVLGKLQPAQGVIVNCLGLRSCQLTHPLDPLGPPRQEYSHKRAAASPSSPAARRRAPARRSGLTGSTRPRCPACRPAPDRP